MLLCSRPDHLGPDGRAREARGRQPTTAIVRVEQLYPLPIDEIKAELAEYPNLEEIRWVQDEPANQGPWPLMALNLPPQLGGEPFYGSSPGRPSRAPSVGSARPPRRGAQALIAARAFEARPWQTLTVYFTDRGIEELESAGVTRRSRWPGWPSGCRSSSTCNPEFETPVERFATWLARLDDPDDD